MESFNGEFRNGAPCWIRTSGLLLRRQLLYPAELKAHRKKSAALRCFFGAGDGNRTHVTSLEGWNSTIELHPHGIQQRTLYHTAWLLSIALCKKVILHKNLSSPPSELHNEKDLVSSANFLQKPLTNPFKSAII